MYIIELTWPEYSTRYKTITEKPTQGIQPNGPVKISNSFPLESGFLKNIGNCKLYLAKC